MVRPTEDGGFEAVISRHSNRLGPTIEKYLEMDLDLERQSAELDRALVLEDIIVDALMHVHELGVDQTDMMARVETRVERLIECAPDSIEETDEPA